MKFLLLLSLISLSAQAKLECQFTQEKQYNEVRDELVMDGKGLSEVNDILRARLQICKDKCPQTEFMTGLCMARKPAETETEAEELEPQTEKEGKSKRKMRKR